MYKMPSNEEVSEAIRDVLNKRREVESQRLLHELVLKRLKEENQYCILAGSRVRKIAANLKGVKILVEKRRSDKKAKKCYVCGGELEVIRATNLYGRECSAGKKCKNCGFKIDKENLAPKRYTFLKR